MEIRALMPDDDRNEISRIYEESWKYAYDGILPRSYLDSIPAGRWANRLDGDGRQSLLCVENGHYIGTGSFGPSRFAAYPNAGEVISIYFLPAYMGRGYGRQLMQAMLSALREQGFEEVFLWVLEENTRARKFYESLGFSLTEDVLQDSIGGKELREVRYVRRLSHER